MPLQVEDHCPIVGLLPTLGEVGFHHEATGRDAGTHPVPDELRVDEAQGVVGLEVQRLVRVKVQRIVTAHAEHSPAPALRAASARGGERGHRRGCGDSGTGLEKVTTRDGHGPS